MLPWLMGEVNHIVESNLWKADLLLVLFSLFTVLCCKTKHTFSPLSSSPPLLSFHYSLMQNQIYSFSSLIFPSLLSLLSNRQLLSMIEDPPPYFLPSSLPSLLSATKPNLYSFSSLIFPFPSLFDALWCQIASFSRGSILPPPFLRILPMKTW
jgi:hypothetical protein